jgi:hypothetical protein
MPQLLLAISAVLVRFGQIMHDALALQMRGQRTPAARFAWRGIFIHARWWIAVGIVVVLAGFGNACRIGSEFLCEQTQLVGTELLAAHAASGSQQLPQQPLRLVELHGHIDEHLLQHCWVLRQTVRIDRHLFGIVSVSSVKGGVKVSHRGGVKGDHPGGCAAFLFLGAAVAEPCDAR